MLQYEVKTNSGKHKCYFNEDCVTKDDDDIAPSRKSKGFEGECVNDEEEAPE